MTPTPRTAVVIQHHKHIHLGNLEPLLRDRGYEITVADVHETDVSTLDPKNGDLLVVLGGHEAAYDLETYPHLVHELRLIRSRIDAELPLLGICLGAQLMAGSLGARNYKGEKPDYSYRELELTEAGLASPLRHTLGAPMLEWHGDHFELPAEATLLASSVAYPNEAFALGDFALGVQFHPEVTDSMHEDWTADTTSDLHRFGMSLETWRALRDEHNARMQVASAAMFTEWLDAVEQLNSVEQLNGAAQRMP